ncbi:unnamed protein product [Effrenium voratum]|nr:unnamed protein product [Effrenium voratum]
MLNKGQDIAGVPHILSIILRVSVAGAGADIMTDVRLERQLRYYFSDKNLWKDEWLMNQLGDDGTGFIPADIIAGFNRVQQITSDVDLIVQSLKHISDLEVKEENGKVQVRRVEPLPPRPVKPDSELGSVEAPLEEELQAPSCGAFSALRFRYIYTQRMSPTDATWRTVSAAQFVEDVNKDPVILLDGLTKCWRMPGLRICWIVAPKAVIDAVGAAGSFLDGGPSLPTQRSCVPLLNPKDVIEQTIMLQVLFSHKRDFLLRRLQDMGITVETPPQGTFYCWCDISRLPPPLNNCWGFFREMLKEKVIVTPGVFFDVNPGSRRKFNSYDSFVRISYGPSFKEVQRGLDGMQRVIERRKRLQERFELVYSAKPGIRISLRVLHVAHPHRGSGAHDNAPETCRWRRQKGADDPSSIPSVALIDTIPRLSRQVPASDGFSQGLQLMLPFRPARPEASGLRGLAGPGGRQRLKLFFHRYWSEAKMTDKVKSKDKEKEKKRKEDLPVSEAKRQRGQAEDKQKKEKKEKEKKGKEKEDKERSKEKEKASEDKEKEKVETPAEPQPARAQGGTSAPPEAREVPLGEAGPPFYPKNAPWLMIRAWDCRWMFATFDQHNLIDGPTLLQVFEPTAG